MFNYVANSNREIIQPHLKETLSQ